MPKGCSIKSSILVYFVNRSALQNFELNYNSWPQFVSSVQTQPGKFKWPDCETPTCEAVLTSVAHSKFVFIELSPELVNMTKLYENKNVGPTEYKLKGMVRSYNKHLNCAVFVQGKWTYFDDLCSGVKEFSNLAALKKQFKQLGWFFTMYELSNTFCEVTDSFAYSSSMGGEKQEELKLDGCEITPGQQLLLRQDIFMNSALNTSHIYSCSVDSSLEVASCLFLPHLSNFTVRSEFTEPLFNACSKTVKKTCQLALSRFIQNNKACKITKKVWKHKPNSKETS